MPVKKYKPTTSSQRFRSVPTFEEITRKKPEESLLVALKKHGGRNSQGRICMRRRGGGHKRQYRIIDFKRDKFGIPGRVQTIEYDPNRSAYIALLNYIDGEKRYILSPLGLKVNDEIVSGETAGVKVGNALPLNNIPEGTMIHNIELRRGSGGRLVRSAGNAAQLMAKEGGYAQIKLPSGEVRMVQLNCMATIGQVGNVDHSASSGGKAGWSRWRGRRPKVRGVAMNPVDHPLGGGEGKSAGGRHPVTPWGKPTKGYKTRKKRKQSNRLIVKRRK